MSSRRPKHHPFFDLGPEVIEARDTHKRTVFILATHGSYGWELRHMVKFRAHSTTKTLHELNPDVKFVHLYPPRHDGTPYVAGRRVHAWFSESQLDAFDNDRNHNSGGNGRPIPDIAVAMQAVIDVVMRENRVGGIPLANMVIGGIGGQAATVAMGVVLALGAKTMRYVGVDGRVPLVARIQELLDVILPTTAGGASADLGIFSVAVYVRAELQLRVRPSRSAADMLLRTSSRRGGGGGGGLVSMLFRVDSNEVKHDRAKRVQAERVLQSAGYTIRVGFGQQLPRLSVRDYHLRLLYDDLTDTLAWMPFDDGSLDPVATGRYAARYVRPSDLHYTPPVAPFEPPPPAEPFNFFDGPRDDALLGQATDKTDDGDGDGEGRPKGDQEGEDKEIKEHQGRKKGNGKRRYRRKSGVRLRR